MNLSDIEKLYYTDLTTLLETAHAIHKVEFPKREIQGSSLISIKTGGCPEDCSYCPQSAHYKTGVNSTKLMATAEVIVEAKNAKAKGATRLCMGAAWREVKDGPEFDRVCEMVTAVKNEGLEVCCTLGMLTADQAKRLKNAGLHAYNHNIDTSEEHYAKIIQTREFDDRMQTINNVREAGITVCTGGILGLGESEQDRIKFIHTLTNMDPKPESITVNTLVPIKGTPLENSKPVPALEILRVVATLRIANPKSSIRLSAGRLQMEDATQFLCYYAGANSIFLGEKLLTSPNPVLSDDYQLLEKCGYKFSEATSANHSN